MAQPSREHQPEYSGVRRWKRYKVSLPVRVRTIQDLKEEYLLAHGREMSEGGMLLYVPFEFQPGTSITIQLEMPWPTPPVPVEISATVRNRTGFSYGVEFISPPAEVQATLLRNLKDLSEK